MSKEYFFRIESNLKEDIIDVNIENEFIYGHDSWIIQFKELHYKHQVQEFVKEYKKEINTYEQLCDFLIWLNDIKQVRCDTLPKIYYIENNKPQTTDKDDGS